MSLSSLLISMILIFTNISHATIFLSTTTIIENNTATVNITINTDLNLVEIELSTSISTPHLWKGFGFDSTSMFGTYAIIIDYTYPEQIPIVIETTLGDHNIGTVYTLPEITIISDINNGITRNVKLQRTINGTYSFPTTPQTFNMISAIGTRFDFVQCINRRVENCQHIAGTGRNIKSLHLSELTLPIISHSNEPTMEPTLFPTKSPSNNPTITPTINPSFNPTITPTINPSDSPVKIPTNLPTNTPIVSPTNTPSVSTIRPSKDTKIPTIFPSIFPSNNPSFNPSIFPSNIPSFSPTIGLSIDPLTIICDNESECKGKSMTCGVNGKYCNLKCTSESSCFESVFTCKNNTDCNILCNTRKACESLNIIGGYNSNLNIACNANSACINSNINGINVNKLDLQCFDEQSCNEMIIKCPSYTDIETVIVQNCKINAIGTKLVADKMIIYAENSWNDINTKESYISYNTQIEMFCDLYTSKCILQQNNGIWNCLETESLCFIGDNILPETTLISNNYKDNNIIICDINNGCDTDIICQSGDCHIICDSDNSCEYLNIYGMETSHSLSIECNGFESCKSANIFGLDLTYLIIKCNGFKSCKNTNFFGNNTHLLNIECLHMNGSCENMNIYCPLNHNGCIVSSNNKQSNDIHTHLNFYAIYGFNDLNINKYKAIINENNNTNNMMHCGLNYRTFCILNTSLFCECDYNQIVINNEDELDNENNNKENGLNSMEVMAIIISGAVLITMFGLIGFCVLCNVKRNDNNNINQSYETVKINDMTNVEMQDIVELQTDKDTDSNDNDTDNQENISTKAVTENNSYQKVNS